MKVMVFTPKIETLDADFLEKNNFMNRSILASNPTAVSEIFSHRKFGDADHIITAQVLLKASAPYGKNSFLWLENDNQKGTRFIVSLGQRAHMV